MPFYRCELAASLTAESAIARIQAAVGPPPTFRQLFQRALGRGPAVGDPPFIGQVDGSQFRVRRDIWYRNDFRPIVTGRVTSVPAGVRIRLSMFLQPAVAVFMLVWFAAFGLAAAAGALNFLTTPKDAHTGLLAPVAMLIVGAVLVGAGFFPEALKARQLLEQALAAPPKATTETAP
jgi:hypothetical protein